MYIDSHSHLFLDQYSDDIDDVMQRASAIGIQKIFLPNIDVTTIKKMNDLASKYPSICFPMVGLHPCYVKKDYKAQLEVIEYELENNTYYGVGETGIDLYWDKTFKKEQIEAFRYQIELSKKYNLPIIIHSRESLDLTIELVTEMQDGNLKGIFHCFNGTVEQCKKVVDVGFMMGLGGVITFKKAGLDDMVAYMPEENILLETDSPYLSPTPYRGKRNESAYIDLVAKKVAEVKGWNLEKVQNLTTRNAENLFSLSVKQQP